MMIENAFKQVLLNQNPVYSFGNIEDEEVLRRFISENLYLLYHYFPVIDDEFYYHYILTLLKID